MTIEYFLEILDVTEEFEIAFAAVRNQSSSVAFHGNPEPVKNARIFLVATARKHVALFALSPAFWRINHCCIVLYIAKNKITQ